jgi:hypothetical protein
MGVCGLDSSGSEQEPVADSCEHGIELSDSVKFWEFQGWLRNCWLLRKPSAPWKPPHVKARDNPWFVLYNKFCEEYASSNEWYVKCWKEVSKACFKVLYRNLTGVRGGGYVKKLH